MVKPRFIKEVKKWDVSIEKFDKEVINPAICSQATIDKAQEMMKNVVERGTGKDIYSKNFSMAGKTGTCQTEYWKEEGKYIASFAGYFPADNPEYSCIVVIHKPNKKIGYYGGVVAAPVFRKIAQKIYSDTPIIDEVKLAEANTASVERDFENYFEKAQQALETIPNVRGMSGMDAVSLLENLGLKVEFSGSGKVKSQSLKAGQKLSKNQKIILQLS